MKVNILGTDYDSVSIDIETRNFGHCGIIYNQVKGVNVDGKEE